MFFKASKYNKSNVGRTSKRNFFAEGGETDPEFLYKDRFNTPLNKRQQKKFNKWVIDESKIQGRDILADQGAYDVQGFFKSGDYKNRDGDGHGSDVWKKPNHPTFSNQSKYSGIDGNYGGNWTSDGGFQPSHQTMQLYDKGYYDWMFKQEPNRPEHLDLSRFKSGVNNPTPLVYANGGKAPIKGTKEQYQAYQDSLNTYNSLSLRYELYSKLPTNITDSEFRKLSFKIDKDLGINRDILYDDFRKSKRVYSGKEANVGSRFARKPVQPIIYEPEGFNQISARNQGINRQDNLGVWNQTQRLNPLDLLRPKEQVIQIDRKEGQLPSIQSNLEFNPIPYTKGSYFTREQQGQEVGGKEYFDKTTGKKLELGGFTTEFMNLFN